LIICEEKPLITQSDTKNTIYLDEGLDLATSRDLFLTHAPRHLSWITLDAGNNCMGVCPRFLGLVYLLDNDDFLASVTALQHNCYLHASFINFAVRIQEMTVPFPV